jgi:anti-sigma B factor antagonist
LSRSSVLEHRLVYHPNTNPPQPFAVGVEERNGSIAVHVSGEIDMATTPELRARLEEALMRGRPAVVDLEDVSFIDGRGVATLAECARHAAAAGLPMSIAHASVAVRRLVEIMGMEGDLTVAPEDLH